VVVTRADLKQSLNAFSSLLKEGKAFRQALMGLATAASSFASALESASFRPAVLLAKAASRECARQKGASASTYDGPDTSPGEQLMAASGLHYLLGNRALDSGAVSLLNSRM
jgi:hypothetical protein